MYSVPLELSSGAEHGAVLNSVTLNSLALNRIRGGVDTTELPIRLRQER